MSSGKTDWEKQRMRERKAAARRIAKREKKQKRDDRNLYLTIAGVILFVLCVLIGFYWIGGLWRGISIFVSGFIVAAIVAFIIFANAVGGYRGGR